MDALTKMRTRISDELATFLEIDGGDTYYKMTEFPLLLLKRYKEHTDPTISVMSCNLADDPEIRAFLMLPDGEHVPIFRVQKYLINHYRDHPKSTKASG